MVRQNKNQKDNSGYGVKLDMFGVISSIKESKLTSSQKPMTKCEVTDSNNEKHTVTFFGDTQPAVNMIGQRFAMSVSCEDFRLQDGRTVETYQGFLRSGNVSQNVPQSTPQTPQNAPQSPIPPNTPNYTDKDACICRQCAGKCAAEAIGGTGVDTSFEVLSKILDIAVPLSEWFLTGQNPTIAAPEPQSFEEQYSLPPEH